MSMYDLVISHVGIKYKPKWLQLYSCKKFGRIYYYLFILLQEQWNG